MKPEYDWQYDLKEAKENLSPDTRVELDSGALMFIGFACNAPWDDAVRYRVLEGCDE